jgi:hypothetical protein
MRPAGEPGRLEIGERTKALIFVDIQADALLLLFPERQQAL